MVMDVKRAQVPVSNLLWGVKNIVIAIARSVDVWISANIASFPFVVKTSSCQQTHQNSYKSQ